MDRIREIQALIDEDRQTSSGKASLFFEKANILLSGQSYEEAIASYDKAIKLKSDYHEAWNNRGVALSNLNRYEAAIASYDKAIKLKPDDHEAWRNRGNALFDLNRYEEANTSFKRATNVNPNNPETWYSDGNMHLHFKRYRDAIESYDKAIKLKPDYHKASFKRAYALSGEFNPAIPEFYKFLKRKFPKFFKCLKRKFLELEKLSQAKTAIT